MLHNWPHLYQNGLVDVTDLGEWQGKDQGGYYAQSEAAAKDGKRWLALPHGIVGLQFAYRKSWFDEVGQTSWPKTLEELRQVGMKLKKKGHPIGQTLGHTFGDAPAWAYPLTWGFGAAEVDRSGKKVVLDSKETVESVKFMQAFWKDACDEGGLRLGRHQQQPRVPLRRDRRPRSTAPASTSPRSAGRTRSRTRKASPW